MMRSPLCLALTALVFCGCTASRPIFSTSTVAKLTNPAPGKLPVTPRSLEQLPTGRYYRFQLMTSDAKNQTSYVGKIVRVDGESVELTDVDREERTPRRMFKNAGVGVEFVEGNKTLDRSEIAAMDLLTPAEVNHRLAIKQTVPRRAESQEPPPEVEQAATKHEQGWHAAG